MKKSALSALMLAVTVFASGCQTTGGGSSCDGWRAIRPTAADVDVMSDRLVEAIVTHNQHGAAVCGWPKSAG